MPLGPHRIRDMSALEIVATVIGLTFTVVGWAMLARAARHFVST